MALKFKSLLSLHQFWTIPQKPQLYDDGDEELGILLMGVTGHGKSATGNTILGREEFVSEGGWGSVTKTYHVGHTRFGGRIIKVVDIPGFADSDEKSDQNKVKLVVTALTKALTKFPNGFHAVLLVVSYANRLTKEVKDTLKYIFDQFDQTAFKRHGVLVVTNGDAFHRDAKKRGGSTSLREWLENNFQERLDACGGRCVLFNNVTEDENERNAQILELLTQIDSMNNENSLYIPEICKFRGEDKNSFEKDRKRIAENERLLSLVGLLKDDLSKSQTQSKREREDTIRQLNQDLSSLKKRIKLMDCKVDEPILKMVRTIEDEVQRLAEPDTMASCVETITEVQNELNEENEWGPWWDNTVKGVADFVNVINPIYGEGVKAAGQGIKAVGSAIGWLFGY